MTRALRGFAIIFLRILVPFCVTATFYLAVALGTNFLDGSALPAVITLGVILIFLWGYNSVVSRLQEVHVSCRTKARG